nr:unnamed protein product [Digitaria exilis]
MEYTNYNPYTTRVLLEITEVSPTSPIVAPREISTRVRARAGGLPNWSAHQPSYARSAYLLNSGDSGDEPNHGRSSRANKIIKLNGRIAKPRLQKLRCQREKVGEVKKLVACSSTVPSSSQRLTLNIPFSKRERKKCRSAVLLRPRYRSGMALTRHSERGSGSPLRRHGGAGPARHPALAPFPQPPKPRIGALRRRTMLGKKNRGIKVQIEGGGEVAENLEPKVTRDGLDRFGSPERNTLRPDGPPGLFSPSGLYTHKPPSTLSPEEQPCAPNWAAPEPRLSLKKKFEALSNRSKSSKRKAEAMKQVVTTEEATPAGGMAVIEDPISDWPTSILKEKHIKALEADGFLPAQQISQWRSASGHEYPSEETEEITVWKAFYEVGFGMPTCDFFRRILQFYGIELLPPLDPSNTEEAALLARCVDPKVREQGRPSKPATIEEPDEPTIKIEPQDPEDAQAKAGATSRGGERSKRPAPSEAQAPVPKKARTLPKPRARTIPEGRAKVSPQPRASAPVGIAIGEIGTSMPQQSSSARRALSDEEILHEIFNPASAPFEGTTPIMEEPCPAGPSTAGQEVEEEFTLGEPEIPMRPSTVVESQVDHMAVEPEAAVPEVPRVDPETTLPEVQAAMPADPPAPEEAQVEEIVAEVLAGIEQLVTDTVIEESEQERRDQSSAPPPSITVTTQAGAEAECSRGKQTEETTPEQMIEEIPRVPQSTGVEEEGRSFRIGSFDPTFEYILDAEEDEQHIDRGLYHTERAIAYFKADRLHKELEREREDRKLQEAEDANTIRTLHLRTKELAAEKEDVKKKLAAAKAELKGAQQQLATAQSKMTDWSNVANRYEDALKTLSADHEGVKEQLRVAVQQRKDADEQLVQILEQQKQLAKNLEGAQEENNRLSRDLVQAQKHLADKKVLDEKLEQAARRMSELEEELRAMKKSDDDLAEAQNRIAQLEKAANPVVKALVPEDPSAPQTFLERLKAMPRQLKAYIKRSSKACLVHVLPVVKSRYPEQEAEPVAEAIAQSLRL